MSLPGISFPGVGAGLVIRRDDGKILLCRRMNAPEAGCWSIPGGKVDLFEKSDLAAMREAEEETGLSISSADFLCTSEMIFSDEGHHWVSIIYFTENFSGDARLTEPDKISDIGWFDPLALPEPLSAFASEAIQALKARAA